MTTSRGFSILSTLVAVAVGSALAAVVVFALNRVIGAQRSVLDRDEVSEFALFVKNILNADVTCGGVLKAKDFDPEHESPLELPLGYGGVDGPVRGDQGDAPGFTLPGGLVRVKRLTIKDKRIKPVSFQIPVNEGEKTQMVGVERFLAQVKLELVNADGNAYRPRYVEVPVLVDGKGQIVACNNQLSLGDSCLAMGFRLDATTQPPSCVPSDTCLVGGTFSFSARNGSRTSCVSPNPVTKSCACPEGFTESGLGLTGFKGNCGKFGCVYDYTEVHQCHRCP